MVMPLIEQERKIRLTKFQMVAFFVGLSSTASPPLSSTSISKSPPKHFLKKPFAPVPVVTALFPVLWQVFYEETCGYNPLGDPTSNRSLESDPEALSIMEIWGRKWCCRPAVEGPVGCRSSDAVSGPHSLQPQNVGHQSPSVVDSQSSNHAQLIKGMPDASAHCTSSGSVDVDMNWVTVEQDHNYQSPSSSEVNQEKQP